MNNNLKSIRIARGLKQKEVATLLGFKSEDRISHWERGQAMPSAVNLMKLCKIYNVSLNDVYVLN